MRLLSRLGFDLVHAWRDRRALNDADAIWAHTEREHILRRRAAPPPTVEAGSGRGAVGVALG